MRRCDEDARSGSPQAVDRAIRSVDTLLHHAAKLGLIGGDKAGKVMVYLPAKVDPE